MHKEAQYNKETKKGTYSHNSHYGELVPDAKINNNSPKASSQNLAAPKGTSAAVEILNALRYHRK